MDRIDSKVGSKVATSIRDEIEQVLLSEDSRIADIWRRKQAGQTDDEIRIAFGNEYPNFIWNYTRTVKALLDGSLPTATSVARTTARTFRRMLAEHEFSPEATAELERRLAILEDRVADPAARKAEERKAREATTKAEESAVVGIYVYSLPHYIRYPYEEGTERTLMKVGRSDRSVMKRFHDQIRTTALPEDPVLLRIYPCEEGQATAAEADFHAALVDADHDRSSARMGGTEWFCTSLKFLDRIARLKGLQVREVASLGDDEMTAND